jgi:predicted nucleic acid-binding protein
MRRLVLDSWAIMAWLKKEHPAAGRVRILLDGSDRLIMNIVNLGEVFYLSVKVRDPAYGQGVLDALRERIGVISASDELVMAAALLKSRHAISYADAFAAATALSLDAPLITGDPELRAMSVKKRDLKIEWIGE